MIHISKPTGDVIAKHAFICREEPELSKVCALYGRDPNTTALKVFYGNPLEEGQTLDDARWGDDHDPTDTNQVRRNTRLLIGTKIQNFCFLHGLAPRVYEVFEAEYEGKRVAVQLTEFLTDPHTEDAKMIEAVHNKISSLGKQYGFSEVKDLLDYKDIMGEKCVDLQQYAFDKDVEEKIKSIYFVRGRYGKVYYQNVPELGLNGGPRKSLDRVNYLKLDKIDFKGKVVWDIGCAGGFFCRYAYSKGAKRVIGFDMRDPAEAAYVLSNYLGYFNIDFETVDLKLGIPEKYPKPDIAFLLSMNFHIPIPERIFEAETVIFEDNGRESRALDVLGRPWTEHFNRYEFIGRGIDHGDKAIYHLYK